MFISLFVTISIYVMKFTRASSALKRRKESGYTAIFITHTHRDYIFQSARAKEIDSMLRENRSKAIIKEAKIIVIINTKHTVHSTKTK